MMGPELRYDEENLVRLLSVLGPDGKATFIAACAERLLPVYRWFNRHSGSGNAARLEEALAALWMALGGKPVDGLDAHQRAAEELVPREDEDWVDGAAYAGNAAAAVAYALSALLNDSAQEAAWAARQVYEALDYRITTRDDIDFNTIGVQEQVEADQIVQRELARQLRDLDLLHLAGSPEALKTVAAQLLAEARSEGVTVFDFDVET